MLFIVVEVVMRSKKKRLAAELEGWFFARSRHSRWARDPVAVVIRREVDRLGNWRNAARGNPELGYRRQQEGRQA